MDFSRRKRRPLEITLTPMIDVVFLLLIFFMVTTTFNQQSELKINLPEADGEEVPNSDKEKMITLTISQNGTYYISGEDGLPHQLINQKTETLRRALEQAAGNSRRVPFVISADGQTPHQAVITALDIARNLGFSRITFATKSIPGQSE